MTLPDRRRANRPADRWVALSPDVKIVADGPTIQSAVDAARKAGEPDPYVIRVAQE